MSTFDLAAVGAGLPVAGSLAAIDQALGDRRAVVLQAPPGTGKTTLVPPLLANLLDDSATRVLVAEPRRVAARAAAQRLAGLAGVRPGTLVGHTVRGERHTSARTRVEFCTTGVLLRRLLNDPELDGVGAVVLDEVHERHLDQDLCLAMLAELRELREDLLVVVMSATISAPMFAEILADNEIPAPIVVLEAEQHPLTVQWRPPPPGVRVQDDRGVTPAFCDHLAAVTLAALHEHPGDALVFVPGAWEVDQVVRRLSARLDGIDDLDDISVLPLHGRLDRSAQDLALTQSDGRRVVVSTSLAESALTVPGVRLVIDSGLSRQPRRDQLRGLQGLVTGSESRSAAVQRAGRAARQGPGVVVRCFSEDLFSRLQATDPPEIVVVDLTAAVLDLACWGTPLGRGLRLPDSPPPQESRAAQDRLVELGALDAEGQITALGRRLVRLPVDPRLGRGLLLSTPVLGARTAAEIVALLGTDRRGTQVDLLSRWRRLRRGDDPDSRAWKQEAGRLAELCAEEGREEKASDPTTSAASGSGTGAPAEDAALALVLALSHPDRIARARDNGEDYLLAGGTGARLVLAQLRGEPWLAVAELGRTSQGAVIRSAVPITQEAALDAAAPLIVEEQQARWSGNRITARQVRRLGAIELSSTPTRLDPLAGQELVADSLRAQGLGMLTWRESARRLRDRLALAHRELGDPWPAMNDRSLVDRLELWLGPELSALASGTPTDQLDLTSALRRLLPWPAAGRLEELVPERITVPSGSRISVQYPDFDDSQGAPRLSVKLQECFGWKETPRICEGRVPVLLELLSPARRPLALSGDLAYFWDEVYPQVRAENRGRYSKHPWPEDPWNAPARSGTTRSGR